MAKRQIILWLCLILSAQAIASIVCLSSTSKPKASASAMDPIREGLLTDMNSNDNKRSDQQHANRRGLEVAVVHDRKGGYGGSDLLKKPSKTKSGASSLSVAFARITLSMCVVSYLFLLS